MGTENTRTPVSLAKKKKKQRGVETYVGDDAVDVGHGVAVAVLAGCELAEVAGGDGADGVEEAEDDAAGRDAVDLDVELEADGARG